MAEKAILEQGFDDSELASIMSEIEDLEKEFMDDNSLDGNSVSVGDISEVKEENKEMEMEIESDNLTADTIDTNEKQLKIVQAEKNDIPTVTAKATATATATNRPTDAIKEETITTEDISAFTDMSEMMEANLELKDNEKILTEQKSEQKLTNVETQDLPKVTTVAESQIKAELKPILKPVIVEDAKEEKSNEKNSEKNLNDTNLEELDLSLATEDLNELKIDGGILKTKTQIEVDEELLKNEIKVEKTETKIEENIEEKAEAKIEEKKEKKIEFINDNPNDAILDTFNSIEEAETKIVEDNSIIEKIPTVKEENKNMSTNNLSNVKEIPINKISNDASKSKMKFSIAGEMDVELSLNIGGNDVNLRVEKDIGLIIELAHGMKFVMPMKKCQ
ncbi:MAG: hypothetical protein HQK51_12830 [Oligoflexia bacterium]|nr:hypothetical protein [Oligoflexia bacterium]